MTANTHVLGHSIYIDFEGNKDKKPTLLGVLWQRGAETEFEQVVFELGFGEAAKAKGCKVSGLQEVIGEIVRVAESYDLDIVSWSTHERAVVEEYVSAELAERLRGRFRDAKKGAKQWLRRCRPTVQPPLKTWGGRWKLDFFMNQTGYGVPKALGPGNTGQRLSYVRDMLSRRDDEYSSLTAVAKGKWTKTLGHNRHDCFGMRHVDEAAAGWDGGRKESLAPAVTDGA